ncbi:hypothetical protein DYBT9275_03579 [Dyadobacter sp. CECT 9275]|uniref:DUF4249 domain-containing protein n=1 Tax=Dyadobacter helix TaxID=2822344 RepID=A0A916N6U6_9BACT|nr:DUF4249 domain-containing protein [Dyadobacter sp. CECT 9275]CAG5005424.1 hypothetical protein DYBT9275_03579 [Dyadobacter sp. CECT 9275]
MKLAPYLLLFLVILSGCESLVTEVPNAELPSTESKLVVQCFISPQTTRINVTVSESVPLFGESDAQGNVIDNATVKISDGTREIIIPYDPASLLYTIDKPPFQIVPNGRYTLTVTDGKRTATGTCTVPQNQALIKSYEIDTVYNHDYPGDTAVKVKMTWGDIPGQANYYRVRASMYVEYTIARGTTLENLTRQRVRNRFSFDWDDTIGRNNFQSDVNLDGETFDSPSGYVSMPTTAVYDFGNGNKFVVRPNWKILSISFFVLNTDEAYYKYHRSLELRGNGENPFAEPTIIYNNIAGGLGCFAAYNSSVLVYQP